MIRAVVSFFGRQDEGQDLAEYCLITALVALLAFSIIFYMAGGMHSLWGSADSTIAAASSSAGSGATGGTGTGSGSTGSATASAPAGH